MGGWEVADLRRVPLTPLFTLAPGAAPQEKAPANSQVRKLSPGRLGLNVCCPAGPREESSHVSPCSQPGAKGPRCPHRPHTPAQPSLVPECTHRLPASPWSGRFLLLCLALSPGHPLRLQPQSRKWTPRDRPGASYAPTTLSPAHRAGQQRCSRLCLPVHPTLGCVLPGPGPLAAQPPAPVLAGSR